MKLRIVDLDGTISDDRWRRWAVNRQEKGEKAYELYHQLCSCDPFFNSWIIDRSPCPIVIFTARPERVRIKTERWLDTNQIPYKILMMRPDDNDESSPDLKMRMLEALASVVQFEVEGVYDDRKDVLQRFEELGIKTHQIKESSRNP